MRLHSPAFSREFRRLWRAEKRKDPELRRLARRQRAGVLTKPLTLVSLRALWGIVPACMLLQLKPDGAGLEALFAAWWFLEVIVIGSTVVTGVARSFEPALFTLPLNPDGLRRLAGGRVLQLQWRPFLDALFVLSALAWNHGARAWLAVVPLSALAACSVWAAAVWVSRVRVPTPVMILCVLLPMAIPFLYGHADWFVLWVERLAASPAPWPVLLSPGGWVAGAFLALTDALPAAWLLGLPAALAVAASGPVAWRSLLKGLDPDRDLVGQTPAEEPQDDTLDEEGQGVLAAGVAEGDVPERCPDAIVTDAQTGWIERLFCRRLSDRERLVLECAATRLPAWTLWARRGLLALAAALALLFVARHMPLYGFVVSLPAWPLLFIGTVAVLPVASGFDRMMGRLSLYGVGVAFPALYPVGARELLGLTLKGALLRGAIAAPAMVAVGWAFAAAQGYSTATFAMVGLKLAVLTAGASPYLFVMAFSAGSNDSSSGWRSVPLVVLMLMLSLVLFSLVVLTFFLSVGLAAVAAAGFVALACAGALGYVRAYDGGVFDLVRRDPHA